VVNQKSGQPFDRLVRYYRLMEAENLQELEIREANFTIKLVKRSKLPTATAPEARTVSPAELQVPSQPQLLVIAPLAGVFYRAPSPQTAPYVNAGDAVTPGQTLCIIEAMKIMNEIKSELRGRIKKILVENGKIVKAGQELFLFEPLS